MALKEEDSLGPKSEADAKIDYIMGRLDVDVDGRISFDEFSKVFESSESSLPHGLAEVVNVGYRLTQRLVNSPVAAVTTIAAAVGRRDMSTSKELWDAADLGDEAAVNQLLSGGGTAVASLEHTDSARNTPLLIATRKGHTPVVKLLLAAGANKEAPHGFDGSTPLHWAADKGRVQVMQLLLDAGANKEATTRLGGGTPLHWAIEGRPEARAEAVRLLLEGGANAKAKKRDGRTPLLLAVDKGDAMVVRLLLEGGADPNARDDRGDTPLHCATEKGDASVAKLLLEAGADSSTASEDKRAPLIVAVSHVVRGKPDSMPLVKLLLEAGADTAATTGSYATSDDSVSFVDPPVTSLYIAARCGSAELVQLLLNAGAVQELEGNRAPLYVAAAEGHATVVEVLLRAGGDKAKDAAGDEALEAAAGANAAVVKLLFGAGWTLKTDGPLFAAARRGDAAAVQVLLEHGANVHATKDFAETPLLAAVNAGSAEAVGVLLDAGADPNTVGFMEKTALIAAAETGNAAVVKRLLDAGADKDAPGFMGQTALNAAKSEEVKELLR